MCDVISNGWIWRAWAAGCQGYVWSSHMPQTCVPAEASPRVLESLPKSKTMPFLLWKSTLPFPLVLAAVLPPAEVISIQSFLGPNAKPRAVPRGNIAVHIKWIAHVTPSVPFWPRAIYHDQLDCITC